MTDEITAHEARLRKFAYWVLGGFALVFGWLFVMAVTDIRSIREHSTHHCGWHEGRGDPNACKPVTIPGGSE